MKTYIIQVTWDDDTVDTVEVKAEHILLAVAVWMHENVDHCKRPVEVESKELS